MALDVLSRILTVFKADTSDMEAGLKKLTGAEKEHAKAQIDAAKERNAGYDSWIKKIGEANQALETAKKVIDFAKDSFRAYAEDLRIRAAAGAVSIDRLKAASLGLRTEHELLTFAAQTQHGVIKATETEMETAQRAMVGLTRAGFDQEEVTKKITEAMISLKVNGLDDLGITVQKGKTDLETYSNLMAELGKRATGVKEGTGTAAEGVQRMGVDFQESFDQMRRAVGELVASLGPFLSLLAKGVSLVADAARSVFGGVSISADPAAMKKLALERENLKERMIAAMQGGGSTQDMVARFYEKQAAEEAAREAKVLAERAAKEVRAQNDKFRDELYGDLATGAGVATKARGGKPRDARFGDFAAVTGFDRPGAQIGTSFDFAMDPNEVLRQTLRSSGLGASAGDLDPAAIDQQLKLIEAMRQAAATDGWMRELQDTNARRQSLLEAAFGPIEQFDAYMQAFEAFGGVFTAFTDAVGAGYTAIVTGQSGIAEAFKKTLAAGLLSIGRSSVVEALRQTALGFGALAFGSPSAGMHFKSAALHAGVAVAAGVAASALGAGSSGSGAAASGGQGGQQGGQQSGSGGGTSGERSKPAKETFIVVYLDPFANQPEHVRRQQAREMVQNVMGGGAVENS